MKTTLKDWPRVYEKLGKVVELTEDERVQFARSFAATPDERWEMNVNCIRALGFCRPVRSRKEIERRKAELQRLQAPSLWSLQLSNAELVRGKMFGPIKRCKS
ncbi:MAG TPA: hypothetical protein VG938_19970 [Verrucomicrobiae bacterium]|jgi:hypothetical protein|nr:hypothetical protein [Verrucomicrobiae bacterium]